MTSFKTLAIATALLVGTASFAIAQNGPASGGNTPAAGGAGNGTTKNGSTGDTGASSMSKSMHKKKSKSK